MRTWIYSYKSQDGLRHESEMEAKTKDEVYTILRSRGIRAIRVTERIQPVLKQGFKGLRQREWLFILCMLIVVGVLVFLYSRYTKDTFLVMDSKITPPEHASLKETSSIKPQTNNLTLVASNGIEGNSSLEYNCLISEVEFLREDFRRKMAEVDVELLANYALIENVVDISRFKREIAKGRNAVASTRKRARDFFAKEYARTKQKAKLNLAVEHLYGAFMNEVDAVDEQFDNDECVLELLDSHRDSWIVKKGEVVWKDQVLEGQFQFFRRVLFGRLLQNSNGEK